MSAFQYHPAILQRYPSIVGGVLLAQGLINGTTPEPLLALYQTEQTAVKKRLENLPLSDLQPLAAWRSAFRAFQVDPTQYRCAAEALLRRLTKKGDIPSINTLVDIGNLVSIRYALPVAVIDAQAIQGAITVHFAQGNERFMTLGNTEEGKPSIGEVIFSDEQSMVIARRWCWRQSEPSAARETTRAAIITIEGHHKTAHSDIAAALQDLQTLLTTYAGGTYTTAILDENHPVINNGKGE